MAFSSPSDRRGIRRFRKSLSQPLDRDHDRLIQEMEELRKRELELKKEEEEIRKKVADLPRQIEETERKQREKRRMIALTTVTQADYLGRPRDPRHPVSGSSSSRRRMTRPEQRSEKLQFLFLCIILGVFLILLCKSLPH